MKAKFVNERTGFIEDSDPIKDMGIGAEIVNFADKRLNTIKARTNLTKWLSFLRSLEGKTIEGNFKVDDYYNHTSNESAKFLITRIESYSAGESILLFDKHNSNYKVIQAENYKIYR
jgi:hypothetical protein